MAIIEVNLRKPALVEEHPGRTESTTGSGIRGAASGAIDRSGRSRGGSSGGGKAKLVGLLAAVVAVGAVAMKLRGRGGDGDENQSQEYEHGPEPEIGGDESGGRMRKVAGLLGLVVALASVGAAARKRRE